MDVAFNDGSLAVTLPLYLTNRVSSWVYNKTQSFKFKYPLWRKNVLKLFHFLIIENNNDNVNNDSS